MSDGFPHAEHADPQALAIRTIAIIGAGVAGRSFALACVTAGFNVVLEDVMPANLRRAQDEYSQLQPPGRQPNSPGKLGIALTVEDAVRNADLAIDFVPDELESKLEIFCMIDRMAPPRTILLTPSDALSITDLASCTYRGDRCFAVRGGFPKAGSATPISIVYPAGADPAARAAAAAFLRSLGNQIHLEEDRDAPMLVRNQPR